MGGVRGKAETRVQDCQSVTCVDATLNGRPFKINRTSETSLATVVIPRTDDFRFKKNIFGSCWRVFFSEPWVLLYSHVSPCLDVFGWIGIEFSFTPIQLNTCGLI